MKQQEKGFLFSDYPDVLSIKELRQALGIGRAGAYKLLETGKIQSFKIGNTYKIPKSALINYVNQQCPDEGKGGEQQ